MSLNNLVKRLQDIMRNDAGINGDAQRIEQMVWILFLKVYDAKEEIWEFYDENYTSIIPEELRWSTRTATPSVRFTKRSSAACRAPVTPVNSTRPVRSRTSWCR